MNTEKIAGSMQPGIRMTRQDICRIATEADSTFKETNLRNLLEALMKADRIERIGRNCYIKEKGDARIEYRGIYTDDAQTLVRQVREAFPYLAFQVFELNWLNEFLNHLVWGNYIYVEVEKPGAGFVYEDLLDQYRGRILIEPDEKEMYRYAYDGTIVVDNLISGAPMPVDGGFASLEKIMVDLLANKVLRSVINAAEIPDIIREMFDKYRVNRSSLMRYARRRHKENRMREILGDRLDTV